MWKAGESWIYFQEPVQELRSIYNLDWTVQVMNKLGR